MELKTKDADEAAFLMTMDGFELVCTRTTSKVARGHVKKTLWFVFETDMDSDGFGRLMRNYHAGDTFVEPLAFSERRAEVRDMIRREIFS